MQTCVSFSAFHISFSAGKNRLATPITHLASTFSHGSVQREEKTSFSLLSGLFSGSESFSHEGEKAGSGYNKKKEGAREKESSS